MNQIQQLRKFNPELGQDMDIFPVTKVRALGAGVSIIYDISAANNNQYYPDLQTALGNDGANIPQEYRRGGMIVEFIKGTEQSSNNRYARYFLTYKEFTTSVGLWEELSDILRRMQGTSEYYNGSTDPILRKNFPKDAPEGVDSYKYAIKQTNDFLNEQYFAIHDNRYYRGQENQGPKEIGISELRTICQNMVHIDITGGCLWVMNMPFAFATGSFRQIAFGAEPHSSTEAGYEVTGGIRAGRHVLQRMSSYDFNTGIVTWSEWKDVATDWETIRTQAAGALQKAGGQMTGDINLADHVLNVRSNRRGIQFVYDVPLNYQGIYVGNGNMRLVLETAPSLNVIHKKGGKYLPLFDEENTVYEVTSDIFNGVVNSQMTVPQALADAVNGGHSGHTPIYLSCNGLMSHCDVFNDGTANGLIWHINNASTYIAIKGVITNTTLTIYNRKEVFDWN